MHARFGEDHEDVGERTIGDPGFGAGEPVSILGWLCLAAHRLRIGARVWFGEAKTADPFAGGQSWQIFAALSLAAIGVDRVHNERGLHTHHGAIVLPRAREQVSLRERAGGVAHELFIFRELAVEIERIVPGEESRGLAFLCHLLFSHTLRPSCVRSMPDRGRICIYNYARRLTG